MKNGGEQPPDGGKSIVPSASDTAALQLPHEDEEQYLSVEELFSSVEELCSVDDLFKFCEEDDYAGLPFLQQDDGVSKLAATSTLLPPPIYNYSSPSAGITNAPYSHQLHCRNRLYTGLPADLSLPEYPPESDWCLEVEPNSNEELQKQQLISRITTTSSQPTLQVDYPFFNADAILETPPPFTPEATVPGKAVVCHNSNLGTTPCTWQSHLGPITESSSSEYYTGIINPNPIKPPVKRKKSSSDGVARKCQHCATEKTPQWRSGPMGPKSLCNACGVRFKSGRLLPEYRPASSPNFSCSKHSSSHRKVLEIRRQKEIHMQPYPPVNDSVAHAREAATAGHNFYYQHSFLPHFLQNF